MFDFDYLSKLYKEDPKRFEEVRKSLIDEVINSNKNPERMRAIQWNFDQRLNKKTNPYSRMIYANEEMYKMLLKLQNSLNDLVEAHYETCHKCHRKFVAQISNNKLGKWICGDCLLGNK